LHSQRGAKKQTKNNLWSLVAVATKREVRAMIENATILEGKGRQRKKGLVDTVIGLNRRFCRRLTPTHVHETNVFGMYRKLAIILLSHPEITRVLDCGAGKAWHFPEHYKRWYGIELIGVDIDADEMAHNAALDEKIACDVTESIPIASDSIDLVMVSSGIEHFRNNERFLTNVYALLRPGGYLLAQFPGRYAPFAIANRIFPSWLTEQLLKYGMQDAGELGFTAYYDRTHYTAFATMAKEAGFIISYHVPGYYSSSYAECFFPLWLCSYIYDIMRFGCGVRNLASYNLFVLQKPGSAASDAMQFYTWQ
jgi:SAM-dependent methyltransferase